MIKSKLVRAKLKDVCKLVTDGTHDTPKTFDEGFPFIKAKEIVGGRIDFENCEFIRYEDHLKVIARSKPERGDTLFAHIGASLGEAAYINTEKEFSIKNVALFKPNPKVIDGRYLYFQVIGNTFQSEIKGMRSGSAQPFVGLDTLRNFEISYYTNIQTQRKIASILSAYDDLIENNTRRIKILEETAQAIYREWFVEFRAPGVELRKATSEEQKLTGRDVFPKGWEIRKLSLLVETQYGYTESASESEVGPKYLRGMDINKTSYIQWDFVPYCPINDTDYLKYKLNVGDILIIRMADPGKIGIIEKEVDAVFASYLIRLKIKSSLISTYYLFYYLISDAYQGYITGASTGTTRKSASAGVITDVNIIIPSEFIRNKFEEAITPLRRMLNNLIERNSNLRKTRDLLLPKLISGEVDV